MGHTKGPWIVVPAESDDPETQERCRCIMTNEGIICVDIPKEDASLVAAAPELLEACRELMRSNGDNIQELHKIAFNVISKATKGAE